MWINKAGPFVDHSLLWNLQYKFEFDGIDVTDSGLGEACQQKLANYECATYSFQGKFLNFSKSPLVVNQIQERSSISTNIEIRNLWTIEQLVDQAINLEPEILTWAQMFEKARRIYPNLIIGNIENHPDLNQSAYKASIRDQCLRYMGFLDEIMNVRNKKGAGSKCYRDLYKLYFKGQDPIFCDESEINKIKFKTELTFKNINGKKCFAPWHGRIRHREFRLHFKWPIKNNRNKLEVLYLGPKITKK